MSVQKKDYDGISFCDFKTKGRHYVKAQIFWVDEDGNRKRTVICLGPKQKVTSEFTEDVTLLCKDFRSKYRAAVRAGHLFVGFAEEQDLKLRVNELKKTHNLYVGKERKKEVLTLRRKKIVVEQ